MRCSASIATTSTANFALGRPIDPSPASTLLRKSERIHSRTENQDRCRARASVLATDPLRVGLITNLQPGRVIGEVWIGFAFRHYSFEVDLACQPRQTFTIAVDVVAVEEVALMVRIVVPRSLAISAGNVLAS